MPSSLSARLATALAALGLAGCPLCPEGELRLVGGALPVAPGDAVTLELRYDGFVAGPERCRGYWYVDGILGGDARVGTVDPCGRYVAPAAPPAGGAVTVEAGEYPAGGCADCCPWASRDIRILDAR